MDGVVGKDAIRVVTSKMVRAMITLVHVEMVRDIDINAVAVDMSSIVSMVHTKLCHAIVLMVLATGL